MESIWNRNTQKPSFESLKGSKETDVLIIGGGIAGILCAYQLKKAGVDFVLAEAAEICGGTTRNTTAKITLGHGLLYDKTVKRFGEEKARLYAEAQIKAAEEYAAYGLIWPLFYTAVFFLLFCGILTVVLGKIEKKLDYYR
jgi:glycine/D-amino acid oxidase-like deaminating enzyme